MSQSTGHSLHDAFGLVRVFRNIASQGVQNVDNSPFVAVVHGSQQFLNHYFIEL